MLACFLGAALRFYALERVPLRGDEAFTARFWAQDPATVWRDLAGHEPHPIGTFVLFWGWTELVGDSEFALRALPALANLIGVALMALLGRRLFRSAWVGLALALLWAFNPFLVWHAQDARNYALWAVASPLAFCLVWQALKTNRLRAWLAYGVAVWLACQSFLLEPFFMLAHLTLMLIAYRERWRYFLAVWLWVGLALTPNLIQLTRLAGTDYQGTASAFSLSALASDFLPALLFGEGRVAAWIGLALWLVLLLGLLRRKGDLRLVLGLWLGLPLLLFLVSATRLDIFRPRYLIAWTAPLYLTLTFILYRPKRPHLALFAWVLLMVTSLFSLSAYFFRDPPKAPDWRSMGDYLETRTSADDLVITANVDPAFGYYYRGLALEKPWSESADLPTLLRRYNGIFIQLGENTAPLSVRLQAEAQFIPPAVPLVKHYRPYEVNADEIAIPLEVRFGELVRLRGYTLLGGDAWGTTLLLYWQPLAQSEMEFVAFVHAMPLASPFPLAQDDHAPLNGLAPTTRWQVNDLLRDAFYLPPVGQDYQPLVGFYAHDTGERLPVYDVNGTPLGDSYVLPLRVAGRPD
jgi:hypothetical protein